MTKEDILVNIASRSKSFGAGIDVSLVAGGVESVLISPKELKQLEKYATT